MTDTFVLHSKELRYQHSSAKWSCIRADWPVSVQDGTVKQREKRLKPSSHYTTLHVGRSLCCSDYMTWLSVFKSLWCSHYVTLCKWSATRGYTLHELTTTLSPNDSIRSLNHVLSWKHARIGVRKELDWHAIWPIRRLIFMCSRCYLSS